MAFDIFTLGIPFFFTLAVVYGALETAEVFKNNRVNAIISLVFAFFVIMYQPAMEFIMGVLPYAIGLFVVVFFLAFLKKLFAGEGKAKSLTGLFLILGLILIFLAYQQSAGGIFDLGFSDEFITTAGIVIVILILFGAYKASGD